VNGLTLDQATSQAIEREPSLRAMRHTVDVARGLRDQAALHPNPSFSFEQRIEPAGSDKLTTLGVEWPLDLFRERGRTAVAKNELAATELALADRERVLAADVRDRYGELLTSIRTLSIVDDLVGVTERQHNLLASRVQEGAAPPLERDLVEVELRRLESDRLLQEGRTEAAVVELKRLLGLSPEAPLRVRDTLESVQATEAIDGDAGQITDRVEARPDVREARARIAIAESSIDRASREGRWDLSLFGTYMRMDSAFPQLGFNAAGGLERVHGLFHYIAAGARITLPVINRRQGEVAASSAQRAAAEAEYEAARLTALTEVAAARARDDRARQALSLYAGGARTLARQNLAVVGQTFELGRLTVFDVLAEQRRYLEIERAYTDALRAAYDARTALKRALGGVR
jgi:cobalt-zinc-cadmium efflux system outer membrane protein